MLENVGKNYNNIFPFLHTGKAAIIKKIGFLYYWRVGTTVIFQKKAKIEIIGEREQGQYNGKNRCIKLSNNKEFNDFVEANKIGATKQATQKTTNDILKNSYENIIISLFKRHFIFYTFKQIQAIKRGVMGLRILSHTLFLFSQQVGNC